MIHLLPALLSVAAVFVLAALLISAKRPGR